MNFQDLQKIENANFYIDLAFRNSRKHGEKVFARYSGDQLNRIRRTEIEKIRKFAEIVKEKMGAIGKNFPSIDGMPEFYQELVRITLDYGQLKKSLGAVKWAHENVSLMVRKYEGRMRGDRDAQNVKNHSKEFYGRASSILKQIKANLAYLEEARAMMRTFPTLKTELYTIAITGFPNIGKSTLLSKLTPAKPDIQNYAFTTKSLNQGYAAYGIHKVQFVDTPGVLNRQKMNAIEQQAHLVMKYLTDLIIYVIDLTEPYSLKDQEKLLKSLNDYDKPIIIYLSKTDILPKDIVDKAKKKYKALTTIEALNERIVKSLKEHFGK